MVLVLYDWVFHLIWVPVVGSGGLKERSRQARWDRIIPTSILLIMRIVKA